MNRPTKREGPSHAEAGLSVVELLMAASIFGAIILSVGFALVQGFQQRRESFETYQAMSAVRDMVAGIQEVANLAQDLPQQEGIGAVYSRYNNATIAVPSLPNGVIEILVYADEASVPAIFGGPQDLNYDGDAQDDLGNASNGSDLKLVPMEITVRFLADNYTYSYTIHRLITMTEDDAAYSGSTSTGGSSDPMVVSVTD